MASLPMNAREFLDQAASIMQSRSEQYDQPQGERSMGRTVDAFNIITGHNLTEAEGWLLMQFLKDVRQWQAPEFHRDSAEDGVAYAALKAEALARGPKKEPTINMQEVVVMMEPGKVWSEYDADEFKKLFNKNLQPNSKVL